MDTALRETFEEVGVYEDAIEVLGSLTKVFVLASNFMVYPYLGLLDKRPKMKLDKNEVAAILEIPISNFFERDVIKSKIIKSAVGVKLTAPYYDILEKTIWGATAMMLSEIMTIVSPFKNEKF